MAAASCRIENAGEFDRALDAWMQRADMASRAALAAAGREVATETAASFGAPGGPVNRTGALSRSTITTTPARTATGYEAQVGPAGLVYVRRVELGKAGAHHAKPHPYFRPGFKRAGAKFVEIFAAAWAAAAPKGGS